MKEEIFKACMATFGEMFNRDIEPPLLKMYWRIFQGYSDSEFESATTRYLHTARFFPKPVDLLELLGESSGGEEGWLELKKGLRDSADFKASAEVERVARLLGGPIALGRMTERDLEFKRKEFLELYKPPVENAPEGIEQRSIDPRLDSRAAD